MLVKVLMAFVTGVTLGKTPSVKISTSVALQVCTESSKVRKFESSIKLVTKTITWWYFSVFQ